LLTILVALAIALILIEVLVPQAQSHTSELNVPVEPAGEPTEDTGPLPNHYEHTDINSYVNRYLADDSYERLKRRRKR